MALFKIDKNYFETYAVRTEPKRTFTSSSVNGVDGAISVFPLASIGLKELKTVSDDDGPPIGEAETPTPEVIRQQILSEDVNEDGLKVGAGSQRLLEAYMQAVNQTSVTVKNQKKVEVLRFEPSFRFTSDTVRKSVIQNVLYPYYRTQYGSTCNWSFSNYHTLNFFTAKKLPSKSGLKGSGAKVFGSIPKQSALIYPLISSSGGRTFADTAERTGITNFASGSCYRPTTAFSFEFYINPRYGQDVRTEPYHAGTLFHVSSSYAVSLVSGSSKDANGFADKFRILLQLSSSAEVPPSSCSIGPTGVVSTGSFMRQGARDPVFAFASDDNVLTKNRWHHVCIRWGGDNIQAGTGSFVIDGIEQGTFDLPESKLNINGKTGGSIRQDVFTRAGPDALFLGNFYEGPNDVSSPDDSFIAQFFHPKVAHRDGIVNMYPGQPANTNSAFNKNPQRAGGSKTGMVTYAKGWALDHPLRAEVHEVKIYKRYRETANIQTAMVEGVSRLESEIVQERLVFYVPPFFVKDTNVREILQTPFQAKRGSTDDPFNVPLAYGVGGHYLNLENFVKEFVTGQFPRLFNLSGSEITTQTGWLSCNDFLYATGSVAKRNLTILPNDNGRFVPNFGLLKQDAIATNTTRTEKVKQVPKRFRKVTDKISGKTQYVKLPAHERRTVKDKIDADGFRRSMSLFVDDRGHQNLSMVSLNNLLATGSTVMGAGIVGGTDRTGSMSTQFTGPTPEDPSVPAGSLLTIFNRTRDASSNQVAFFDASNLFYGDRIQPRSYVLSDDNITGSNGSVDITLRDNGKGNLYRADCSGSHAEWNSVGTLMYDEGLAVVKAPTLPRFGADQFKVKMRGQRTVYVMQISVPAPAGSLDLSNNPTYSEMAPSALPADSKESFTYLTNLNFLDENLNVICKSNFSQAIVKRVNDRFMVRIRLDF